MRRLPRVLLALTLVLALVGCVPGGGASDVPRRLAEEQAGGPVHTTLSLYAYGVPKVAYDELVPAYVQTPQGRGVEIQQSFGPSGDQSRKVAAGARADMVNMSVEPEITRLEEAGIVNPDWKDAPANGSPYGSVVVLVVRAGNPKNIHDWDDLLRPGVEVVTPNPFSSGSAKWNLLAPYTVKSQGGADPQRGLDYVQRLVHDHVRLQPKSGREATEAFLQGAGDVLLSYENEALFIQRQGEAVEHVIPPETFRIDSPVAVVETSPNREAAQDFVSWLYGPDAQRIFAETGFRPHDPAIMREYAGTFPTPGRLWAIEDVGGWAVADPALFAPGDGTIARIYEGASQ